MHGRVKINTALNRRDFIRLSARKTAEVTAQLAHTPTAPQNWLRPPFAETELRFLLDCTRRDKCIEACEFDVLFKLPERMGRQVSGTPAMDLLNQGCRMCVDWPCVKACEPQALRIPDEPGDNLSAMPRLARVEIDPNTCLPYLGPECGACAHACPIPGALEWENGVKPIINEELCTGCALCREACIADPKAVKVSVLAPKEATSAKAS